MPAAPHALVVEDEPVVQKLLARILERDGRTVHLAASAPEALELIEREGASVTTAFIDAGIAPTGCDPIVEALAAREAPPAIVLISGQALPPSSQALLDQVGGVYVAKPFGPRALLEAAAQAEALRA